MATPRIQKGAISSSTKILLPPPREQRGSEEREQADCSVSNLSRCHGDEKAGPKRLQRVAASEMSCRWLTHERSTVFRQTTERAAICTAELYVRFATEGNTRALGDHPAQVNFFRFPESFSSNRRSHVECFETRAEGCPNCLRVSPCLYSATIGSGALEET
jgi:hypothetical protein